MKPETVYMGVDAGTTKLKLMLYDSEMNVIGSASRDTVVYTPEPGASEIDMNELWNSFCSASLELKETYPEEMSRLVGLAIRSG